MVKRLAQHVAADVLQYGVHGRRQLVEAEHDLGYTQLAQALGSLGTTTGQRDAPVISTRLPMTAPRRRIARSAVTAATGSPAAGPDPSGAAAMTVPAASQPATSPGPTWSVDEGSHVTASMVPVIGPGVQDPLV
jgi:hypothetical protein